MAEIRPTATFNGLPCLAFVQGEDRSITVALRDLNGGAPIDLTAARLTFSFQQLGGGTVRRMSGPLVLPASASAAGQPFLVASHGLVTGDPVTFTSTGTLPVPLDTVTTYTVEVVDVNTFTLLDGAGAPVAITAAAVGPFALQGQDVTVTAPSTSGLCQLALRAPVTMAIQDGLAQSFQIGLQANNQTRIIIERHELDVYPQVAP